MVASSVGIAALAALAAAVSLTVTQAANWDTVADTDSTGTYLVDGGALGRRFDGIGALSGGGATSRLLVDYPDPARSDILDLLFKPAFGASLHTLKVEMGGDTFSGCGTEPSHQHWSNQPMSFQRGYEWFLMREAARRRPDVQLYGLPWGFPAFLGPNVLTNQTAEYAAAYAAGAQAATNLTFTHMGIWNEDAWSPDYVTSLRRALDAAGQSQVKLVVADNAGGSLDTIVGQMDADAEFKNAVYALGVHYPHGSASTPKSVGSGKVLWSSEDSSTHDNGVGGGCWARILNWNYVYGNYTSTIMWNIVSSYYEDLRWFGDSLLNAAQPWSGHYEIKSPLWATAHTTQFAQPGWTYLKHGSGSGKLVGGGTYVSLLSPDNQDLTIVVETMNKNTSLCIRSNPSQDWTVAAVQNVTFKLVGTLSSIGSLTVWKSVFVAQGQEVDDDTPDTSGTAPGTFLFEKQSDVPVVAGVVTITIESDALMTLSTTTGQQKGETPTPAEKTDFPLPHVDDFQGYENDTMAAFFSDMAGSFAVLADMAGSPNNKAMTQVVPESPTSGHSAWHGQDSTAALSIIGSYNITDVSVHADVLIGGVQQGSSSPLLSTLSCDTDPSTMWQWNASGSLPGSIVALQNGAANAYCMDVDGCNSAVGTAVWMWPCVDKPQANCDSRNQLWRYQDNLIISQMRTGFCLDGPTLTMQPCDGASAKQQWQPMQHAGGVVSFKNVALGKCLSSKPPQNNSLANGHVTLAARVGGSKTTAGCGGASRERGCVQAYSSTWYNYGYFFTVRGDGTWSLYAGPKALSTGKVQTVGLMKWYHMDFSVAGSQLTGSLDGKQLFAVSDPESTFAQGWAGVGSGFHLAQFDNFSISETQKIL